MGDALKKVTGSYAVFDGEQKVSRVYVLQAEAIKHMKKMGEGNYKVKEVKEA